MLTLSDGRNELWQWDTGRTFVVGADCTQVHFSNKVFGRSIDVDVVDGVAVIPDILLQTEKDLNVWAFVGTAENGYTKISKTFKVNRRNKPADYVFTPANQTTLEEIKQKLDYLESIQDPDAIKDAVEDYLEQNPVESLVQSVNGKTGEVKLTAEDVGAISQDKLQDATNVALAQAKESGEFDGKDGYTPRKGVDYFDGKDGKDGYTPVKGVDYWTPDDKQEIVNEFGAVSYNEQTLTEAQKAQARANIGAGDEWFQIADVTTTEEVTEIAVTTDIPCRKMIGYLVSPTDISGDAGDWFGPAPGLFLGAYAGTNASATNKYRTYEFTLIFDNFVMLEATYSDTVTFWSDSDNVKMMVERQGVSSLNSFFVARAGSPAGTYPVGTNLKVWGLKK